MGRLNPNALWIWPLLAALVLILMSFQDPFLVAFAALLLAAQGPTWRWIHALERRPARASGRAQGRDFGDGA